MENYINVVHIREYHIFDVLYSCGQIKLFVHKRKKALPKIIFNGSEGRIENGRGRHIPIYIYIFDMPKYKSEITLSINNNEVKTNVNKYTDVKGEIIMSTITKNQDEHIIPWIEYYKHLGVDRFMIYDNSERKTLGKVLEPYVKKGIVLLYNFGERKIPYRPKGGRLFAQPLQQNHSLHAFKNAKYIGMFDIDEYLNPQQGYPSSLLGTFTKLLNQRKTKYSKLAGFSFQNKYFYNPLNKDYTNYKHFNLPYSSSYTTGRFRKKMFINPANVSYFTIHTLSKYSGKDLMISEKDCFFNHYRYIGLSTRNGKGTKGHKDYSILRHLEWLDKNLLVDSPMSKQAKKEQKLKRQKEREKKEQTVVTKQMKKERKLKRRKEKDSK